MAVFHVERNTGYTVMSNHHLRNKELTLKAKGLLSQMLSLPEDWDYKTGRGQSFVGCLRPVLLLYSCSPSISFIRFPNRIYSSPFSPLITRVSFSSE